MHLADLLWTVGVIVFTVVYFLVLFRAVLDVFRRDDLGPWGRAGWFGALLVVPVVALIVYVVTRADTILSGDRPPAEGLEGNEGNEGHALSG